jgi:hypothetical protein
MTKESWLTVRRSVTLTLTLGYPLGAEGAGGTVPSISRTVPWAFSCLPALYLRYSYCTLRSALQWNQPQHSQYYSFFCLSLTCFPTLGRRLVPVICISDTDTDFFS